MKNIFYVNILSQHFEQTWSVMITYLVRYFCIFQYTIVAMAAMLP